MNLKEYICKVLVIQECSRSFGDRNYKTEKMNWRNIIRNLLEVIIAIFRMILIGLFYIAKFMFMFFILLFFGVLISQNNKRW